MNEANFAINQKRYRKNLLLYGITGGLVFGATMGLRHLINEKNAWKEKYVQEVERGNLAPSLCMTQNNVYSIEVREFYDTDLDKTTVEHYRELFYVRENGTLYLHSVHHGGQGYVSHPDYQQDYINALEGRLPNMDTTITFNIFDLVNPPKNN